MKTKEVLDSIEQLKNKFTEKLNKLNEMPKKQQHWLDGHWSGHVNAYEHVLSLIDVRFEMWQEEQKVTALCNELKKVKEHNEKHGDKKGKRVTLRMLSAVFRRGIGAYNTNPQSVRPNVSSSDQWAYARVNAFLFAVRTGRFRSGKFDRDLLPNGHPLKTDK